MFQQITIKNQRFLQHCIARALAPGHDANHQLLYALAAEHDVSRGCPLFFSLWIFEPKVDRQWPWYAMVAFIIQRSPEK